MTKDRALELLAELVGDDPDYAPALDALRPKPRVVKVQTTAPEACKTILRNLSRPEGFGFSPPASETNRLMRAELGPEASDYGAPEAPGIRIGYVQFDSPEHKARDEAERAYNAERARWVASPDGARFESDRARHEARRAQFAYVSPKGAKTTDGTLATYVRAFMGSTSTDSLEQVAA